ncbi:hypothetical protein [Dysgonomonas sp. GY617]|uniref:hypothetical protein n=1 Tax=Dysgonomonas sp. GY617 TaxID=2780420 RepID=UPI0018837056|nr:hypothetical protein [Dysgonomonas sp. GY617]MBF0576043.1 hypothetical protein [Dysgonomonas sp. GY617]
MANRISNTKIGDIFCAQVDGTTKRYLQYIISDMEQLNSDVIRAFKKVYPIDATPILEEIVSDQVDFYAHCVTKAGIKFGFWQTVGNSPQVGDTDILFRDKRDWTISKGKTDDDWWIWYVNQPFDHVGKLSEENRKADLGLIFHPEDIVCKLKTGTLGNIFAHFE